MTATIRNDYSPVQISWRYNLNMDTKLPTLILVIPCYNEADVLPLTAPLFRTKIETLIEEKKINRNSSILFVNDGSLDTTWNIIKQLSISNTIYSGISLSRNQGHQNALLAGLMDARNRCDIAISVDCDGQDDINAINKMVDEYLNGSEVVYGVRNNRDADSVFKRTTAEAFYKLLSSMGAESVFNHADYRLLSNNALNALSEFKETNLYLRGLVPLLGFKSSTVEYCRTDRLAGKTHYTFHKMISLAIDGVTSLSTKPIRIISTIGIVFGLIGFVGVIWAIITALSGYSVSGWASMICVICLLGGLQLLALGIIGEYVGKIYLESKHRPRYIISERTKQ